MVAPIPNTDKGDTMGWERMKSETEKRNERIRGFMPFTEGANVEGTLHAIRLKDDDTGFFIIRNTKACTVNVQDAESTSGQGKAQIGELVGVRKTGATKILRDLKLGTLVSVTYKELKQRTGINPKSGLEETNPYHNITVDVYRPENEEEQS
jgi:hypothetical protein